MLVSLLVMCNLINDVAGFFFIVGFIDISNGNVSRVIIFVITIVRLRIV